MQLFFMNEFKHTNDALASNLALSSVGHGFYP